jgi:hypothetical protein
MIFIVLFILIAAIVISLNIYDNSNLEKIKLHLESNNCQDIIYSKGTYKAICTDKIVQIDNAFSVDLKKKYEIRLKEIEKIEKKNLTLLINDNYKVEFKNKENMEKFYKNLEDIKNR